MYTKLFLYFSTVHICEASGINTTRDNANLESTDSLHVTQVQVFANTLFSFGRQNIIKKEFSDTNF